MHINKIRLVNFRGMEDLTVEFALGVNVIIGDNGAGKTSLLNGICVALGALFNPVYFSDPKLSRQIKDDDVRVTSVLVGDITENTIQNFPVKIEVDLMMFHGQEKYDVIKEGSLSSSHMIKDSLKNKMREVLGNPNRPLPLLNFQSAERRLDLKTNNSEVLKTKQPERKDGYKEAFAGTVRFSEILEWCVQMDYTEYKLKHEVREYKKFKAIVSRFMQAITGSRTPPHVDYSAAIGQLVFYDGQSGEPLNILSAGYQNVLCMVMDIARRAVLLNPTLDNFEKLEGIVIIDEIDLHLHPKWQWKILDALRATFPSVQFIVATHSPIVLSSAKDSRLIFMTSPNEVEILENAYGINVNDVLELRQQSTDMPPELKDLRKKMLRCLNDDDIQGAEAVLKEAVTKYGEDSALVKRLQEFFEMNKWMVEA